MWVRTQIVQLLPRWDIPPWNTCAASINMAPSHCLSHMSLAWGTFLPSTLLLPGMSVHVLVSSHMRCWRPVISNTRGLCGLYFMWRVCGLMRTPQGPSPYITWSSSPNGGSLKLSLNIGNFHPLTFNYNTWQLETRPCNPQLLNGLKGKLNKA